MTSLSGFERRQQSDLAAGRLRGHRHRDPGGLRRREHLLDRRRHASRVAPSIERDLVRRRRAGDRSVGTPELPVPL